ncbi:MAG: hypothetical protein K0S16_1258 [Moraxellaceae bacterium]|nr:hypothetical protein [Moraxellaceae bacterium]
MQSKRLAPLALAIAMAGIAAPSLADEILPNLKVNGFATVGGSWVTNDFGGRYLMDARYPDSGIDEDGSLSHDSVLGIQLSYELSDKFDLVGQLVSSGRENFDTKLEWGYLAFQASENLRLRAGRFALPMFMYSESLRVGQSYPWARPPAELYAQSAAFSSLDGLDLLYRQPLGTWTLDTQLSVGGAEVAKLNGKLKDNASLNLTLSNGSLSLHGGYSRGKVDLSYDQNANGLPPEQLAYLFGLFNTDIGLQNGVATFADVGVTYDDGNWFAAVEYGEQTVDGMIPDYQAGHVTLGHYFGKWLPYAMAGKINSINSDECYAQLGQGVANGNALLGEIAGHTAAISAAVAAQATANAAADAALAANNMAAYSTQLGLAAMQTAIINQETNALVLKSQLAPAVPALSAAMNVACAGQEQTSYSLGFRYDATRNVSVKFEIDHLTDFGNSTGHFNTPPGSNESTQVITFNINAAF